MESNNPESPKSAAKLNMAISQVALRYGMDGRLVRKAFITAVIGQLLPENALLKGGSALSLRYPLKEARNSRDIDSVYIGSRKEFIQRFENNLEKGWNGFSGSIMLDQRGTTPFGVDLSTYFINLEYKHAHFRKVSFELSPYFESTPFLFERILPDETSNMFQQIGFDFQPLQMVDIDQQLAEKLNALNNPSHYRGKDIRDIITILRHHTPGLAKLREEARKTEEVPFGHAIHMLQDATKNRFLQPYLDAGGSNFDKDWKLVNRLLQQVDLHQKELWQDTWDPKE